MNNGRKNGLLIYQQIDLKRNERFIELLLEAAEKWGIQLHLMTLEEIMMEITTSSTTNPFTNLELETPPTFMINRSVAPWLNELAEARGLRVFNNAMVARTANDKRLAHAYFHQKGIPMLKTIATSKHCILENVPFPFPYIIKDPLGRGGTGVHQINSKIELEKSLSCFSDELIVQPICDNPGKDLRVYIINNQVVGAVLRESVSDDIRANLSTGGTASLYTLSQQELSHIQKVMEGLQLDFVGIDFLFHKNGEILFNEMEDAVGCRSLYMNSSINIADIFIKHVSNTIQK